MRMLKFASVLFAFVSGNAAWAQSPGMLGAGQVWGNPSTTASGLAQPTNLSKLGTVPTYTLEEYNGGTTKSAAQNTAACLALVTAHPTSGILQLGFGTYAFNTGCPAFGASWFVRGQGVIGTTVTWISGSLFTWGNTNPAIGGIDTNYAGISDLWMFSSNVGNLKKAIELFSVSGFTYKDVLVSGAGTLGTLSGGGNSVGMHVHGHQFIRGVGANTIAAETGIQFSLNPNTYIAADTVDINNTYIISSGHPAVVVDPGALVSITGNEGNWVGGTHGLYYNDTSAVNIVTAINTPGTGYVAGDFIVLAGGTCTTPIRVKVLTVSAGAITNAAVDNVGVCSVVPTMPAAQLSTTGVGTGAQITAQNIGGSTFDVSSRTEQGTDGTAYSVYVSASNFVQSLIIRNFGMEGGRNGFLIHKVRSTTLQNTNYQAQTSTLGINADATNGSLNFVGTWWSNTAANAISMPLNRATPDITAGSGLWTDASWGLGVIDIKSLVAIGSSSGFVTVQPQAAAGTPILLWPTTSGTLVASATSPLVANAVTGVISCSTCATTAGANIPTIAQGDLLFGSAANVLSALAKDAGTSRFLKNSGTSNNPAWAQPTFTDLATGTATAFTLGGTVSGGGNQINNVVIGTSTPLAGTFTTLTANTSISSPIHTSSGSYTFQSNGSTFAGLINTSQQWFMGTTSLTPASGTTLTVSQNTGGTPAISAVGNILTHKIAADGVIGVDIIDTFGTQGFIGARYAGGTQASKTATPGGTVTFSFGGQAWDTSAYVTGAGIDFLTTGSVWSGTSHGMSVRFRTTADGTAVLAEAVRIHGSGGISVGTTTDPGVGSAQLNAQFFMPNITTTSAAQTGTVCWTTGTGKFTADTTVGCLTSLLAAKNITERLTPETALSIVDRLSPFAFRYKQGWGDGGHYEQFGLGAEEVALVDERLVGRDPQGTLQGVRYQEMTAVLAGAIQQLNSRVKVLELQSPK